MADDLIHVLTRFHREVVMPDVRELVQGEVGSLRSEMLSGFDATYKRFDRLDERIAELEADL